jgi:hypothetical protein
VPAGSTSDRAQQRRVLEASLDGERLEAMPVNECVDQFVPEL